MHPIRATARYSRALHATAELLGRLKLDTMFVGNVARAAWLNVEVSSGAVDVLAVMTGQQKGQVAMMAANRGFRVDREELDATEELDLIPLNFVDPDGEVRVHVLLASNALYGRMVSVGIATELDERTVKIPRAEDLALMLLMAEDQEAVQHLTSLPEFDLQAFRERLASIGLGEAAAL
ncbi:MAG: hypothetical protein QOJ98_1696 [Acidobacteriota bacterium]|jgi:hypothetical protein|nr:hypothetical protein [Acidobacteriota bacterium]